MALHDFLYCLIAADISDFNALRRLVGGDFTIPKGFAFYAIFYHIAEFINFYFCAAMPCSLAVFTIQGNQFDKLQAFIADADRRKLFTFGL